MKHAYFTLLLMLTGLIAISGIACAVEYQVYDPAPDGAGACTFINNRGEVVVRQWMPDNIDRIFVYNPITHSSSNWVDISTTSSVWGLNDNGQVLMQIPSPRNPDGSYHYQSVIWDQVKGLTMLSPNDDIHTTVYGGINNLGQVTGQLPDASVFLWHQSTGFENLGFKACVSGINDLGQITGKLYGSSSSPERSFFWSRETGVVKIDDISRFSEATSINNRGQVAGPVTTYSSSGSASFGVYVWDVVHGSRIIHSTNIAKPYPANVSINDNGVVAFSWGDGVYTWDETNGLDYFKGGAYAYAYDINNSGMITSGTDQGQVLWVPVPEPSSLAALGFGLVPMAAAVRLRRRKG